jgi:hypothetical protein
MTISFAVVQSRVASADELICVASTPLSQGGEGKMGYAARRKLIAYEGGAAQQWTFETVNNERVKMMLSCEPQGMKVSIFFSKRPCNADNLNVYRVGFNATDLPLFQKEGVGPDEIIVQLEGSSLQTKLARSIDMCNDYEAFFQIPQTGVYRLKIVRLRKEWASVKGLNDYPPVEYEVFLDVLLTELLQFYMPEICGIGNGFWVTSTNLLSDWPVTIRNECSEHQSRGVKITSNVMISRDFQAQSCAEEITSYRWNRKVCYRDYHLDRDFYGDVVDPSNSSLSDLRIADSNYIHRKILFVGDIHMRDLATLFRDKVCRYQHEDDLKINKASQIQIDGVSMPYYELRFSREANNAYKAQKPNCAGSKDESCQLFDIACTELTMMFIEAKFCESGIADKMKGVDYVLINCGHFPAQSAHYSFGQFRNVIEKLLLKVAASEILNPISTVSGPSPTTLFWLENTAQPLRQDEYIIRTQDWRTYHRLMLFDAIVREEAKKNIPKQLHIVPAFHGTFAVFDKLCNCGHYSDSAIYPQLMSFVDVLRDWMLKQ